jgi:hypothetical protein
MTGSPDQPRFMVYFASAGAGRKILKHQLLHPMTTIASSSVHVTPSATPPSGSAPALRRRPSRLRVWSSAVGLLALALGPTAQAQQWWKMTDEQFAAAYANDALNGTRYQPDAVAWMLLARLSQPAQYNNTAYTTWELWPSDPETFHPQSARAFAAVGKVRPRPILQASKVAKFVQATNPHASKQASPVSAGEEVTRNPISYRYITGNGLTTASGVNAYLTKNPGGLNFPVGTIETKAVWTSDSTGMTGAYSETTPDGTFYLQGLHIMAKFKLIPPGQQYASTDAWLWTTFEFNGNPGLTNAQGLLNVKDTLPVAARAELLKASGVTAAFPNLAKNYVCNGVQTTFVNSGKAAVLLGNTMMENFAFQPTSATSPTQWTSWKISCHTCHGEASAQINPYLAQDFFVPFPTSQGNVGALPPSGNPNMLKMSF